MIKPRLGALTMTISSKCLPFQATGNYIWHTQMRAFEFRGISFESTADLSTRAGSAREASCASELIPRVHAEMQREISTQTCQPQSHGRGRKPAVRETKRNTCGGAGDVWGNPRSCPYSSNAECDLTSIRRYWRPSDPSWRRPLLQRSFHGLPFMP